jgi:16S rRNA (uracil1498-N3)-methyltransferase
LLQAIPKQKQIDFILQKATELGVGRFELCYSERSIPRMKHDVEQDRLRRWEQIMIDACSQSGRCRVPELKSIGPLEAAVGYALKGAALKGTPAKEAAVKDSATMNETAQGGVFPLLLDPGGRAFHEVMAEAPRDVPVCLGIGPEGGFSEEETALLHEKGFVSAHLGPRILRVETAVVAALTLVQSLTGNMDAPTVEDSWNEFPIPRDSSDD